MLGFASSSYLFLNWTTVSSSTAILASKSRYLDRIIMEAIEIELQPNNMNKETGFCLNKS
jgi:hypothetical protein